MNHKMLTSHEVKSITKRNDYTYLDLVFPRVLFFEMHKTDLKNLDPPINYEYFRIHWLDEAGKPHETTIKAKEHSGYELNTISHKVNDYDVLIQFKTQCRVGGVLIHDEIIDSPIINEKI